ncbi:MAG: hypothetical protein U5M23_04825 [Marinagarivorans sp.]|nr:hypothetical protein [Marinagarivorans sp.]
MGLFVFILCLSGCHSFLAKPAQTVSITFPERNILEFTGRGAMAAMMMSGSMGAMGIAIGVAIDEGIAKDLTLSAEQGGFNRELAVTSTLNKLGYTPVASATSNTPIALTFIHLGFRAKGDLVTPWVEVLINDEKGERPYSYQALWATRL